MSNGQGRGKFLKRAGLVILMGACAMLMSQGADATLVTLSDGNAVVDIDTGSSAGVYNWTIEGVDQMHQEWFWYRIGSGQEQSIDTLNHETLGYLGTSLVQMARWNDDWQNSGGNAQGQNGTRGLWLKITFTLTGGSAGTLLSDLSEDVILKNRTDQTVHFFEYTDFDLGGTITDASVVVVGQNMKQIDEFIQVVETNVSPLGIPEVNFYANTLGKLTDGDADDLDGSTGPIGPGDLTWALQWSVSSGADLIVSKDKNFNQFVPEPLTMLGMFLGLGSVGAYIRKRRMA